MADKAYQDSYFGSLVYDEEMLAWIGEFYTDRGHKIRVEFDGENENDLQTVENSKTLMPEILERENEFRLFSATQLSAVNKEETLENLYSKLTVKLIGFSDDGSVAIEFDDGDSFGKNAFVVSVDEEGNLESVFE